MVIVGLFERSFKFIDICGTLASVSVEIKAKMPYEAVAVANHLIERAKADGESLTPMKVQKLVYFAHGWHLAIHDEPLLRERVEAWQYGPVVRELYHELKEFGASVITKPVTVMRFAGARIRLTVPIMEVAGDPDAAAAAKALVDRIWKVYGRYSAIQLSNATHAPGSPWDITWRQHKGERHAVIDDALIKADFLKRANAQLGNTTMHTAVTTVNGGSA